MLRIDQWPVGAKGSSPRRAKKHIDPTSSPFRAPYVEGGLRMDSNRSAAYRAAGVNIEAGNSLVEKFRALAESAKTRGVVSELGGFGGIFRPDVTGLRDPALVASTDGVGTKLKLAFAFNKHDTVGIDLVAMSVNDILALGATPLFFLDYFACGKLDTDICETVVSGVAEGCRQAGCALLGGETAEMPDMYPEGEYDLAGFGVGLVDNDRIVDGSAIQPGDAIIGIASSGPHSNGYSLIRKILAASGLSGSSPLPGGDGETIANALLEPTIIYAKSIRPLLRDIPVKGMAHITGGGFYDNIPRILPKQTKAVIDFGSWEIKPVFRWIKEAGKLSWPEMLQIFNTGIGFILVVPKDRAEETANRVRAFNLGAWKIGHIALRGKDEDEDSSGQVQINFPESAK